MKHEGSGAGRGSGNGTVAPVPGGLRAIIGRTPEPTPWAHGQRTARPRLHRKFKHTRVWQRARATSRPMHPGYTLTLSSPKEPPNRSLPPHCFNRFQSSPPTPATPLSSLPRPESFEGRARRGCRASVSPLPEFSVPGRSLKFEALEAKAKTDRPFGRPKP